MDFRLKNSLFRNIITYQEYLEIPTSYSFVSDTLFYPDEEMDFVDFLREEIFADFKDENENYEEYCPYCIEFDDYVYKYQYKFIIMGSKMNYMDETDFYDDVEKYEEENKKFYEKILGVFDTNEKITTDGDFLVIKVSEIPRNLKYFPIDDEEIEEAKKMSDQIFSIESIVLGDSNPF